MQRFFKRAILALVPAMLSALVLWVPAGASDLGLSSTGLSCNDGTQLNLTLDPTQLAALTDAVAAINLYPAGDPALACSLSAADPGGGNPQYDYAVGAGYRFNPSSGNRQLHFALSAHDGPHGAFGTYNSMSAVNPGLDFDGDVTCLFVMGNEAIVGGVVRKGGDVGQEGTGFAVGFRDNGAPGNSLPDQTTFTDIFTPVPQTQADCIAESVLFTFTVFPVMPGNVTIRDAP
jgi:hypothetical protein